MLASTQIARDMLLSKVDTCPLTTFDRFWRCLASQKYCLLPGEGINQLHSCQITISWEENIEGPKSKVFSPRLMSGCGPWCWPSAVRSLNLLPNFNPPVVILCRFNLSSFSFSLILSSPLLDFLAQLLDRSGDVVPAAQRRPFIRLLFHKTCSNQGGGRKKKVFYDLKENVNAM